MWLPHYKSVQGHRLPSAESRKDPHVAHREPATREMELPRVSENPALLLLSLHLKDSECSHRDTHTLMLLLH